MYIYDDGIKLDSVLKKPDNFDGKCPIVIIIHGFTGNKDEELLIQASDMLNKNGFATLRTDMYGHGKSDGVFREHTLFKWMSNAMTLIDYARDQEFVTDIYLCGHSQGGLTVMLAAALKHEFVKGIIALSPAAMIPELARKGKLLDSDFDPDHLPDELPTWNEQVLGNNYIRVAQTIHVEESIDRYDGPVLIVQGTNDMPDLMASAKAAHERYKNSEMVLIDGDDHCYGVHMEIMVDAVKNWICKING